MRTIKEYLNDPRITNDSGLMSGPEEIKIIHAIRLKQQDEMAGMSFREKAFSQRQKIDSIFSDLGLPPPQYVNL